MVMTAVTKHSDKSQFGEAYTSTSPFRWRRKSGQEFKQRKSVGAGADAGPWRRSAASWLAPHDLSACFHIAPRTSPGVAISQQTGPSHISQ